MALWTLAANRSIRFQNVERFADAKNLLIQLVQQVALHIAELQRLFDHAHFAIDLEARLTGSIVDVEILPKGKYALAHDIAIDAGRGLGS